MRPRTLKIKGLNSFIEEQTIDFNKLTERGLFGIFGSTGSGKSTILDAITLALYGEIPRNTKEFVNSEVDMLYILYEFSIMNGKDILFYVVERSFKRTDEGIRKSKDARFYIKKDEDDIDIIAEGISNVNKNVERIIGLKAEDFTRSVVLPQGKFSEFLRLTGAERRSMLERIFGLEKYGKLLTEKIKHIKNKKREELIKLESQLMVYGNITEEGYKEQEEILKAHIEEEEKLIKELEEINKKYEKTKYIWELQQELSVYVDKETKLNEKQNDYSNKEVILTKAQDAEIIKPYIDGLQETKKKKKEISSQLDLLQNKLQSITKEKVKVESQYLEILNTKNSDHPVLLQKQADINQGIKILEDKNLMEEEREKLRVLFSKNTKEIQDNQSNEKEINTQIIKMEKKLKLLQEEKEKTYVTPTFREEIQKAYEIEKEYISLQTNNKEIKERIDILDLQVKKSKKLCKELLKQKEEKRKLLSELNKELNTLKEKPPGNKEMVFNKHKIIEELKSKYKIIEEQIKKKEYEQGRYNRLIKKAKENELIKEALCKEKEIVKQKSDQIKKEIDSIQRKNMAAILAGELKEGEKCPVCGSTCHIPMDFNLNEERYNHLLKKEKILSNQFQEIEEKYHNSALEYAQINNEECQCKQELETINMYLEKENPNKIMDEISHEEQALQLLLSQIDRWEKDVSEKEKQIIDLKDEMNTIEREEVRIKEGLIKDDNQYKELKSKYEEVSNKLNEILYPYNKIKKEYNLNNVEEKVNQIREWDKIRVSQEKEEKKLREKIKSKEKEKETLIKLISKLSQENATIKQSEIEKSEMIQRWEIQIKKLTEDKEPYHYRDEISEKIKALLDKEIALKKSFEKIKSQEKTINEEHIKLNVYWETLKENYKEQKEKLDSQLEGYDFSTYEEVLEAWIEKEKINLLKEELKKYEEALVEVKNNIQRICIKLKEKRITEEEWERLKEKKNNKTVKLEMKSKSIAVMQEKLNTMKNDLQNVLKLYEQKTKMTRTFSLIDELFKLVQGYKFVEYIASNKLKYIAREASKTLKQITMGRYALELDSSGNFIMRDDFNGGMRRSASTLSGGETFLTSLSLALALSSQIQLNNSSPLEFFFLDEGFGSLDNNLLDVVMTALEKLHSQQLSVGIISHVEELKNRIPVKLIVEPAMQGICGSKVRIE